MANRGARRPVAPARAAEQAQAAQPAGSTACAIGLRKTGSSIAQVFTGTQIDEALYDELESALLMADAGVDATAHLLADLKRRVKEGKATEPAAVKALLVDAVADTLAPLQRSLEIGAATPTVIMVVGVNGAGKTTSIGKLTHHLADGGCNGAAGRGRHLPRGRARAARGLGRPQPVDIVSAGGRRPGGGELRRRGRPARARGCDVVIADTAGRLPTQVHLMDELKKIRRTIAKAQDGAPHEVLLVVDGNTGQNALAQVKAFDAALGLTGLVVTKLDGTAKGGVLAAIARWCVQAQRPIAVYFIGVGEKLEDLQTFDAREFAQALVQ